MLRCGAAHLGNIPWLEISRPPPKYYPSNLSQRLTTETPDRSSLLTILCKQPSYALRRSECDSGQHWIIMTATPFKHSPLNPADPRAIQILNLLPSRDLEGPVYCELRHSSLNEDNVRYEAVSYTWGDFKPGHRVFINGLYLDVTPNCLQALKSFRRKFHSRTLWVDAICIDQRDTDESRRERDRQVMIMGDIYRKAQKVLAWLGPEEPTTARTISKLKRLAISGAIEHVPVLGLLTAAEPWAEWSLVDRQDRDGE